MSGDTYTGMIKTTVLDENYNPLPRQGAHVLDMSTRDGRYSLRCMANEAHANGHKLLTEPVRGRKA